MEPENRLVARTLERRWNEKLQQLAELEGVYAQAQQVQRLEISEPQRQQILHLAIIYSRSLALPDYNGTRAQRNTFSAGQTSSYHPCG